jgi:3'(2'), 5'-bisphosphate nucleotidase
LVCARYGLAMDLDGDLSDADDGDLAAVLAERAGKHLLGLREARFASSSPLDAAQLKALGDEADRTANDLILASLRRFRPHDAILSEESTDDLARLDADRVWIVDPLDGTREYKIEGSSDWAVHIALWERHGSGSSTVFLTGLLTEDLGSLTLGVVSLPALGLVLRSDQPMKTTPVTPTGTAPEPRLRIVRSLSREQPLATGVAAMLSADEIAMGSAGAKAMAIVRGEADAYIHTGGQWEWDSAAPAIVAQAHGLFVTRVDGSPLRYNQRNTFLPDLVMCRAELADRVMAAIRKVAATLS